MEIGPEESIMEKVKSFDFASGKKLADLLLADILPDLPKDAPLIVIPDGPLGVVPFEMLVLNDGGKIVTDKTIPYVTGAEFFGDRNRAPASALNQRGVSPLQDYATNL